MERFADMAGPAYGWQKPRSVRDWLFAEPFRFEFYQAVRLLEGMRKPPASEANMDQSRGDPVRFRSRVSFEFPASEIHSIDEIAEVPRVTVNFLGLAGVMGPLPEPYTEMVIAATARKDPAPADFLDIFNHRLLMLLYRARQAHRPSLTAQSPDQGAIARYLFSLIGLGLPQLRKNFGIPARALLHYSGILARRPGSAVGLERLLSDYLRVRVRVHQFEGSWQALDPEQWTAIGANGRNQALGNGALLGTRVWDQNSGVVIGIGPLSLERFEDFLPSRPAHTALAAMTRFYLGDTFCAEAHLILEAKEVPAAAIGRSRLGYTSWLRAKEFDGSDQPVRVSLNT